MGVHHGVLVAELPAAALLAALDALVPRFVDRGPLRSPKDLFATNPAHDDGWEIAVGELGGKAHLLDTSFLLSGMEPDLVANLAAATGALVIGRAAETVSGTFTCVVARGDRVLRHFFHCRQDLQHPYSFGEALPTEADAPLMDADGQGFDSLLRAAGFDHAQWIASGPWRRITWTADHLLAAPTAAEPGRLSKLVEAHRERHRLTDERRPGIALTPRPAGAGHNLGNAFGISDGPALGATSKSRKPWWRFW